MKTSFFPQQSAIGHLLLWAVLLFAIFITAPVQSASRDFDHFSTGFPLSGAHVRVDCETCHQRGVFKGTPRQCNACHNGGIAEGKNSNHITTSDNCDDCHTTFSWNATAVDHMAVMGECSTCHQLPRKHVETSQQCDACHNTRTWDRARFDHSDVTPGTCKECHEKDKPRDQIHANVTQSCDACHSTRNWEGGGFDHSNVAPGTCAECHEKDKPRDQIHANITQSCDACHTTRTWEGGGFDHSNVVPGSCAECHGNDKPRDHPQTTAACDNCHRSTTTWTAVQFDHSGITAACSTCHAGDAPNNHFPGNCESCHTTTAWGQTRSYSHNSGNYPGDHNRGVTCASCHGRLNADLTVGRDVIYRPSCAWCHANDFRPEGDHIGGRNGTVEQNKNCGGSGCHRITAGGWG